MYQSRSTQCTNSGLFEVDTMTCEILAFKAGRAGKKREKHAYCSMHVQDTTNTTPRIISSTVVLSSCCLSLSLSLSLSLFPSLSPIFAFHPLGVKRDNHPLCSCFFFLGLSFAILTQVSSTKNEVHGAIRIAAPAGGGGGGIGGVVEWWPDLTGNQSHVPDPCLPVYRHVFCLFVS